MASPEAIGRKNAVLCVETLDPMRNFALLYRIFVSKREPHLEERLKCPC